LSLIHVVAKFIWQTVFLSSLPNKFGGYKWAAKIQQKLAPSGTTIDEIEKTLTLQNWFQ
jgi:hypothetical protein